MIVFTGLSGSEVSLAFDTIFAEATPLR